MGSILPGVGFLLPRVGRVSTSRASWGLRRKPAGCCGRGRDPGTPGRTSVPRAQEAPKGVSEDQER